MDPPGFLRGCPDGWGDRFGRNHSKMRSKHILFEQVCVNDEKVIIICYDFIQ